MNSIILLMAVFSIAPALATAVDLPALAHFEGAYVRNSSSCGYASRAVFSEETDPATGVVVYHLQLFQEDGRMWCTREYRELNQKPWYTIDLGRDGIVSGRSRLVCNGSDCTLSNEHKTCVGTFLPRCTGWESIRQDQAVFEGNVLSLFTEGDEVCTFEKR